MYSHQLEQIARLRTGELRRTAGTSRVHVVHRTPRNTFRNRTGWTMIAIGLRIAGSGSD